MLSLVLAVTLTAAPADNSTPVKLASPGFNAVNVQEQVATFFADHFAQQLSLQGFRVVTASEIAALLGFERQKELLGCSENSTSCMAELANALGADAMIVGSVAKFDASYTVNLKIISAGDATPLAIHSGQADGEKALLAELNRAAERMGSEVLRRLGRIPPPAVSSQAVGSVQPASATAAVEAKVESGRSWPLLPTILGGVVTAAGAGLLVKSFDEVDSLRQETMFEDVRRRQADATWQRVGGLAGIGAGIATIGVAAILYATSGSDAPVQPSVSFGPQGAGLAISGVLP